MFEGTKRIKRKVKKVKVLRCEDEELWYSDSIGESFFVWENPQVQGIYFVFIDDLGFAYGVLSRDVKILF